MNHLFYKEFSCKLDYSTPLRNLLEAEFNLTQEDCDDLNSGRLKRIYVNGKYYEIPDSQRLFLKAGINKLTLIELKK